MSIIFTSFLWALAIFLLGWYLTELLLMRHTLFERLSEGKKTSRSSRSFWQRLKNLANHTFFTPGFFVKRYNRIPQLQALIDQAGQHLNLSVQEYCRLKQVLISLITWACFFYILIWGNFFRTLLLELIFIMTIIKVPDLILRFIAKRRAKKADRDLPNFIDMLSMSINTGLNFLQAFEFVARRSSGVLGEVSQKTLAKIAFGFSMDESLATLPQHLPSDELSKLVLSIKQARQLGVSLAETLTIQSQMIRNKRRQRAQELSQTAAVKIAIPLVFFIFPALLIIYIGPGLIRLFYT